ncbi:MAG: DUF4142 domain-containing protein [Labilithrix sp.]|nr:DUF4142 domain-containing protein [Labilithrix sp.]
MPTLVTHGLIAAAAASLAFACGRPHTPPTRSPATLSEPTPQAALEEPSVQQPNDPIANDHNAPQRPIDRPMPQREATLEAPTVQAPIDEPVPQKPFYGPGTTAPADRVLAKTEKPLSDAQVLGVAIAANDGEVQMAELAMKRASGVDVKQFAAMLKASHKQASKGDKALASKTKIASAESDVSAYLKSDTDKVLSELRGKTGKEFDRAYIDSQVKVHKDVLTAIDNRLVPSAENGEVKAMLGGMRSTVAHHLTKAEEIQKKEASGAASSGKATRPSR